MRKTDNGAYISLFAQDDYRIHPRVTLNLGVRYDLQFPLTDPAEPQARVRARRAVDGVADRAGGAAVPGRRRASAAASSRPTTTTSRRASGSRGIRIGDGRMSVRAGVRHLLRQHHRQRVEHHRRQPAVHGAPVVPDGVHAVRSVPQPAGRRRAVPVRLRPGEPALHAAGAGVRPVARLRVAVHVPDEPDGREGDLPQLQRDARRTSARSDGTCPASIDRNYPVFGPGATAANVNSRRPYHAGRDRLGARARVDLQRATTTGCSSSAERRGARFSAKAYYTFGKALEDVDYQGGGLPAVQNSNRIELERGRTSADRTHSLRAVRRLEAGLLRRTRGAVARALLNDWTLSAIVTLQSGTPLTITPGQDRNFDGLTNDRADIIGDPTLDSGRPREELIEEWFNTRRLRAAGDRHRRHRRPQHRRGPGLSQRRPRPVPRRPAGRPHDAAVPRRGDERLQHRQPERTRARA